MPDLLHLFKRSKRFSRLCDFRLNQIRSEGASLIHLLQICEDQHKYITRMKDQADCDLSSLRIHLFNRGFGELLNTEPSDDLQYRHKPPYSDRFLNGMYKNSLFVDMMEYDTDDELEAAETEVESRRASSIGKSDDYYYPM
jgi:hypothetical protein